MIKQCNYCFFRHIFITKLKVFDYVDIEKYIFLDSLFLTICIGFTFQSQWMNFVWVLLGLGKREQENVYFWGWCLCAFMSVCMSVYLSCCLSMSLIEWMVEVNTLKLPPTTVTEDRTNMAERRSATWPFIFWPLGTLDVPPKRWRRKGKSSSHKYISAFW